MARAISKVAPDWWDYTTLDPEILADAARLTADDLAALSRPGFQVNMYDSLEGLYCAEALEYVSVWKQATADDPVGICGPIGPTEQLPLVAQIVNDLDIDLRHAHFWGMDEWIEDGQPVDAEHPLSFARADLNLCFNRIRPELQMPRENIHFPVDIDAYAASYDQVRCLLMQGGQGEVKHWAFNDPPKREGAYQDEPPPPEEYLKLGTRVTDLHPLTVIQNARTSGGGYVSQVPTQAATVGPLETWKSDCVSIWHPGHHDNAFGIRLTALMISKNIVDTSVPMSLLARHPNVRFSYYRGGIGRVEVDIH
ncbi:glucosamine-6-phosphate isomerase [Aeoliella sp.]|uniref:glucosamine-6-phosphate isomerase n=1 Tax=Aeoliella sp. TaxID=2795800 RepID=UPI003CCC287E